jgi:hypothetical protein
MYLRVGAGSRSDPDDCSGFFEAGLIFNISYIIQWLGKVKCG